MATTENCVSFIETFSPDNSLPEKVKWKRKTKYKVDGQDVREFINPDKDILVVIVENTQGVLNIQDVIRGVDAVAVFNGKVSLIGNLKANTTPQCSLSDLKHLSNSNQSKLMEAIKGFIEPYRLFYSDAESDLSLDDADSMAYEFMNAVQQKHSDKNDWESAWKKQFGILFDLENVYGEIVTFPELPGFEFIKVYAGGDWEEGVTLYLYTVPSAPDIVQTYLPLDKGNIYLKTKMCAVGSSGEYGDDPTEEAEEEEARLQEEIDKPGAREKLDLAALESFKEHLIRTEGIFVKK